MFDDLVVSGANPKKTNKPWTVVLSAMIQAGLLGILILIPLIYTEALPKAMLTTFLVPPPPPPPPPPPAAAVPVSQACGAPDSERPDDGAHRHPQEN